jgi:hypothetical protein
VQEAIVKAGGIELLGKLENDVLYDIDSIDNNERAMQKVSDCGVYAHFTSWLMSYCELSGGIGRIVVCSLALGDPVKPFARLKTPATLADPHGTSRTPTGPRGPSQTRKPSQSLADPCALFMLIRVFDGPCVCESARSATRKDPRACRIKVVRVREVRKNSQAFTKFARVRNGAQGCARIRAGACEGKMRKG